MYYIKINPFPNRSTPFWDLSKFKEPAYDTFGWFNPFPNDKFWTLPNREFADDNFKFHENGRKFSKRVENTVGKRRNCS